MLVLNHCHHWMMLQVVRAIVPRIILDDVFTVSSNVVGLICPF